MSRDQISPGLLLQYLEGLAVALNIEVRYESLADEEISIRSGGCLLLGHRLILIDTSKPLNERARILARELSRYDLEGLYLLPQVRDFIALQLDPREKNRPQR